MRIGAIMDIKQSFLPRWRGFNLLGMFCSEDSKYYSFRSPGYYSEEDFAEAYFNRAIVYTYMTQNQKAIVDLSKAGELGMVSAYKVIKLISEN